MRAKEWLVVLCMVLCSGAGLAQEWVELSPAGGPVPAPRQNAAAVYDVQQHRMVVFGGRSSAGDLNDVWAFDLADGRWVEITPANGPAPAPRFTHNGVYDPEGHRMIIFSGREVNSQGSSFFNDVWAFDLSREVWVELEAPALRPNVRYGTAAVFDPVKKHLVMFAGFTDEGRFDDTWRFDPAATSWIEVSPESHPGRRCLHTASYDRLDHRMIIYGGQRDGALDDIWAFDLARDTWMDLTPSERPEGRFFATSVYDVRNHRILVFGGNRGGDDRTDQVWAFGLEDRTWEEIVVAGPRPPARDSAVAIYVEAEDRMVIFGGIDDGQLNDVWSLNQLSGRVPTAVQEEKDRMAPAALALAQNYPNPFNSDTVIRFVLPASGPVELAVYDLSGQQVATLAQGWRPAGTHAVRWKGRDQQGRDLASGVYLYRLRAGSRMEVRKLALLR